MTVWLMIFLRAQQDGKPPIAMARSFWEEKECREAAADYSAIYPDVEVLCTSVQTTHSYG